jgi:hypothetical protein
MIWPFSNQRSSTKILAKAISLKNFARIEEYLNERHRLPGMFHITNLGDGSIPSDACEVEFTSHRIALQLGQLDTNSPGAIADRLVPLIPLFVLCHDAGARGKALFSLGDRDYSPSVAFCSNLPSSLLIPDFEYLQSHAHREYQRVLQRRAKAWSQRKSLAIWRGVTTGVPKGPDWRSLPRVQLCEIGALRPDLFDIGITGVVQLEQAREVESELRSKKLMRPFMKRDYWGDFNYHIDIDGNSNAWSGLFTKLLTGSPVLKVASPDGYRQWYYDQLQPFVNFVPVKSDMSDLLEKLLWLHANDDKAQAIGLAGRSLAKSLGYEGELEKAKDAIIERAKRAQV